MTTIGLSRNWKIFSFCSSFSVLVNDVLITNIVSMTSFDWDCHWQHNVNVLFSPHKIFGQWLFPHNEKRKYYLMLNGPWKEIDSIVIETENANPSNSLVWRHSVLFIFPLSKRRPELMIEIEITCTASMCTNKFLVLFFSLSFFLLWNSTFIYWKLNFTRGNFITAISLRVCCYMCKWMLF